MIITVKLRKVVTRRAVASLRGVVTRRAVDSGLAPMGWYDEVRRRVVATWRAAWGTAWTCAGARSVDGCEAELLF